MINLLEIKNPAFLKTLSNKELKELASEIREFLIRSIAQTGGHLSSNLGVVELTIALYYVFDYEKDKILFDVGHQAYVHKILTGRAKEFSTLRQYQGLSGYINRFESEYDIWESGHSSTSISAMAGMLLSNTVPLPNHVISVIGDSSITNGIALEGLNFLGQFQTLAPIIILNDNKMGISKSVGALSKAFVKLRNSWLNRSLKATLNKILPACLTRCFHRLKRGIKGFIQQDNIFEDMGFDYYGPYDGNDLIYCIKVLNKIKNTKKPVIIHFLTKKGKGYTPSEMDEIGNYHGVSPFDVVTGKPMIQRASNELNISKLVSQYLVEQRKKREFFVVTPAMKVGAELEEFAKLYPSDFYDVGIAEEHGAVMAAGMAISKKDVVLLMYSTFSQRAYDQILNDISRQNLKVIIGLDRAGIVGEDGSTHQGIYDVSMLMGMPNIKICMPKDAQETIGLFNYAFEEVDSPIVIRYPRGTYKITQPLDYTYRCDFSWEQLYQGHKINVISYGPDVLILSSIAASLDINLYNARGIKPMDEKMLAKIFDNELPILVIEQVVSSGTLYHKILEFKEKNHFRSSVFLHGFHCDTILPHGSVAEVSDAFGFSKEQFIQKIEEILQETKCVNEK